MRFTIVVWGLGALWLAFPAISMPTPLSARTSSNRFAIQARDPDPDPVITRAHLLTDDQAAKRQRRENYPAAGSDDLETNAQMPDTWNVFPPDRRLQPPREDEIPDLFRTAVGQESRDPVNWLLEAEGVPRERGSGRVLPVTSIFPSKIILEDPFLGTTFDRVVGIRKRK